MRLVVLSLLGLCGCAAGMPPNPRADGGPDAHVVQPDAGRDAGSIDEDAGHDAEAPTDAGEDAAVAADGGGDGGRDAGGPADAGRDAGGALDGGLPSIVVDGVIEAAEWAGAAEATSTTATGWTGNELRRILATARDGRLYLAIEGVVEGDNAMVVFVDNALGDSAGVADLSTLTDSSGSLDDALSAGFVTPASFRADYAWGTQDMSRSASGSDARMGWRDIAVSDPSNFAWLSASEAPTTCGPSACETSIPLATLGGTSPRTIALFARITNSTGFLSPNQTLPMDDASDPRTVSALLELAD